MTVIQNNAEFCFAHAVLYQLWVGYTRQKTAMWKEEEWTELEHGESYTVCLPPQTRQPPDPDLSAEGMSSACQLLLECVPLVSGKIPKSNSHNSTYRDLSFCKLLLRQEMWKLFIENLMISLSIKIHRLIILFIC